MKLRELFLFESTNMHLQEWHDVTEVPMNILRGYLKIGDSQRNHPEDTMRRITRSGIMPGSLAYLFEHVGDISNRISPMHSFQYAMETSYDKATDCLRFFQYDFRESLEQSLVKEAEYLDMSKKEIVEQVMQASRDYAAAHRTLLRLARTPIHQICIQAAVALGDGEYEETEYLLKEIRKVCSNEQSFIRSMQQYM